MLIPLTVAVAALVVCVLILARMIDRDRREHARERTLMLNQLMHLAGRTWQPPPAAEPDPAEEFEPNLTYDPSYLPDDF